MPLKATSKFRCSAETHLSLHLMALSRVPNPQHISLLLRNVCSLPYYSTSLSGGQVPKKMQGGGGRRRITSTRHARGGTTITTINYITLQMHTALWSSETGPTRGTWKVVTKRTQDEDQGEKKIIFVSIKHIKNKIQ